MRIACLHIPQLSLQCATRLDPSLRGAPLAVVSAAEPIVIAPGIAPGGPGARVLGAPIVVACSRAAWALGVRVGMTATGARGVARELRVLTADVALERETARAIADALLALTPLVDLGGRVGAHLAMYAEVPAKLRGARFGERVLELLGELGLAGRVGIADDRFTAWVAAAHGGHEERGVVAVPRGGSAAFLAPRPLSLLAIGPEVLHMLESLGIRTLGEFAALPAPSVARPLEADYQALARGDGGTSLRAYAPDAVVREEITVTGGVLEQDGTVGGPSAIALVARRLALRLTGRGRAAGRLDVSVIAAGERELPVALDRPAGDAWSIARALEPVLEAAPAGPWRLRAVVSREVVPGAETDVAADVPLALAPSSIALVLSSSASLFEAPLGAERRDAHRRTRRGKHRRRGAPAQSSLFGRVSMPE